MDKQLDIITTSLEALLQRGTSPKNVGRDSAAFDAFCGLVNKEPDCIPTAAKLIVSKMQSMQEWEALQALQLLEACMQHCGAPFHAEVGKFRFLNELIKLISPKYLGDLTPESVRTEIIQLLYMWMLEYPKETKIREAYEMLKKQRVVQSDPSVTGRRLPSPSSSSLPHSSSSKTPPPPPNRHPSCSILEDSNQSKLLQKLLQSKRPEDLQAANKLIKSMVSEEERKMEERCRIMMEMESIQNNVSLLTEMLDNFSGGAPSSAGIPTNGGAGSDWELIKELYATCEGFRMTLVQRAQTLPSGDDDLFQLVISCNESLNEVLAKYTATLAKISTEETSAPLLDMSSARPSPQRSLDPPSSHFNDLVDLVAHGSPPPSSTPSNPNNVDLLNDLLSNTTSDSVLLSFTPNTSTNQNSLTSTNQNPPNSSNQILNSLTSINQNPPNSTYQNLNSLASINQNEIILTSTSQNSNSLPSTNHSLLMSNHQALNSISTNQDLKSLTPTEQDVTLETSSLPSESRVPQNTFSSTQDGNSNSSNDLLSISPALENSLIDATALSNGSKPTSDSSLSYLNSSRTYTNDTSQSSQQSSGSSIQHDLISNSPLLNLKSHSGEITGRSNNIIKSSESSMASSFVNNVKAGSLSQPSLGFQSPSFNAQKSLNKFNTSGHSQKLQSPTTINKLKALKDLDEMVGESLNRLGLNEEVKKESKDEANGAVGDGSSRSLEETNPVAVSNGSTGYTGSARCDVSDAMKCEGTREVGKGDSTMLQEDDEQLLLDHSTMKETDDQVMVQPKQESEQSQALNPGPPPTSLCDNKLGDIHISLADIQPSGVNSICAMDNVNQLTILIHLTRSRPKPNVAVFVVTAISKHTSPLCSYLFQPVVPKGYKLKLQPPSSTSLPAFNPFLPSPAITQIMLIASPQSIVCPPTRHTICLKFVVSYEVEEETLSDMGEVLELPLSEI